jgi:hypothetical protein
VAEEAPLILVTTVDIGEGRSDCIEVRQGDEPLDLARAFVAKHALPTAITDALAQHLMDNLQEAAEAAEKLSSSDDQLVRLGERGGLGPVRYGAEG